MGIAQTIPPALAITLGGKASDQGAGEKLHDARCEI